jgi:hypothetical protein
MGVGSREEQKVKVKKEDNNKNTEKNTFKMQIKKIHFSGNKKYNSLFNKKSPAH